MDYECPYCGASLEDAGEAFVAHLRASEACRTPWEHESDTTAAEWSKR